MRRTLALTLAAASLLLGTPALAAPPGCNAYRDPRVSLNGSSSFVDTRRPGKVWLGGYSTWSGCALPGITVTLLQATSGNAFTPVASTVTNRWGAYGFPGRMVPRTTDFMVSTSSTDDVPGTRSQIWHVTVTANPSWSVSCTPVGGLPPAGAFDQLELELDVNDNSVDWAKPVPATLTLTNVSDSGIALAIRNLPWLWLTNRLNGEVNGVVAGGGGGRHVLAPDDSVTWQVSIPTRRCQHPTFGQPLHSGDQHRASAAIGVQLGQATRWLTATDSSIVEVGAGSATGTTQHSDNDGSSSSSNS